MSSTLALLNEAIQRIYAAAGSPGNQGLDLDFLRDLVGAEHVVLMHVSEAALAGRVCSRLGKEAALVELGQRLSLPVHQRMREQLGPDAVVRRSDVLSARQIQRTPLYQQVSRPVHGGLSLTAYWQHDPGWGGLTFCRSLERRRDFNNDEMAFVAALRPHLEAVDRVHFELQRARAQAQLSLDLLHQLHQGVVLLDRHARLVFLNDAAENVVFAGQELFLENRQLCANRPSDNRQLAQAIATAAAYDSPDSGWMAPTVAATIGHPPLHLSIRRPRPHPPWVLSVVPAHSVSVALTESSARVAVLIHNAPAGASIPEHRLRSVFNFTAREAELAALMALGWDLRQAAAHLEMTVGTARQHLKQVFQKTGVKRQGELVSLLLSNFPFEL